MSPNDAGKIAKREALLPEKLLKRVNVDATVQEKAITFPADTKLCHRMRIKLVAAAKKRGIKLRQTYIRVGKRACIRGSLITATKLPNIAKRSTYFAHN